MWSTVCAWLTERTGSILWDSRPVQKRRARVVRVLLQGVADEVAAVRLLADVLVRYGGELPERAEVEQALLEAAEVALWEVDTAVYVLHPR